MVASASRSNGQCAWSLTASLTCSSLHPDASICSNRTGWSCKALVELAPFLTELRPQARVAVQQRLPRGRNAATSSSPRTPTANAMFYAQLWAQAPEKPQSLLPVGEREPAPRAADPSSQPLLQSDPARLQRPSRHRPRPAHSHTSSVDRRSRGAQPLPRQVTHTRPQVHLIPDRTGPPRPGRTRRRARE